MFLVWCLHCVYEELHQQRRYGKQDAVPAKCAALLLKYGFNIPCLISTPSTFRANEEQFGLDSGALAQSDELVAVKIKIHEPGAFQRSLLVQISLRLSE